jgi:hypothetical protein
MKENKLAFHESRQRVLEPVRWWHRLGVKRKVIVVTVIFYSTEMPSYISIKACLL